MKMSDFIFSKGTQINADDLLSKPLTITITGVVLTKDVQQPVAIRFDGDKGKPFLPCLTMRKVIDAVWEGANFEEYKGRKITIYRDPNIVFGKEEVGGVRISHMSGIDRTITLMLLERKGKRKKHTIFPIIEDVQSQPDPTVYRDRLRADMEAVSNDPTAKREWWAGLSMEEKTAVKEMANG